MQLRAIRAKVREKLQSGQLPRELWPRGECPDNVVDVPEAREDICSACDEPIHAPAAMSEMITPVQLHRVFTFHRHCEALWRDEASRLRIPRQAPPPA
jgi:hypothetical protein